VFGAILPSALTISCVLALFVGTFLHAELPVDRVRLPSGFQIHVFSDQVPGARSLALSDTGTIFVSTRQEGKVYAVEDLDGDFRADRVHTIVEGMRMPNGIAYRNGSLYVAEVDAIHRLDRIDENLAAPPKPITVCEDLPSDRIHGWRYIAFGPDGKLYVPVGAPCNVCNPSEEIYAAMHRMNADGTGFEVFAWGIRNTVGFDWHPETDDLWFTDNGRDWMGDDTPPDELNRAPRPGLHFGFPFLHGTNVKDPQYWSSRPHNHFEPPVMELGPHVAALGMKFYRGSAFPDEYQGHVFIAEHGSWNRTVPIGYCISLVRLEGNRAISYEIFAEGWLQPNGRAWGRPVDILELPDGSFLVSDDKAGAIYRIFYAGN
jgi:glucose/arabinose dehydrogenase